MTPRFRRLWLTLVLLLVLLAIEFGASFLPLDRSARGGRCGRARAPKFTPAFWG